VTKVAPVRFASLLMGVWFLASSAASKVGGWLAGMLETIPSLSTFFMIFVVVSFGASLLNEFRFGFLSASGGQISTNQGVNFRATSGLQGVTQDPRDMGFPQVSFGGLFSTIGDPTSFVSRENRSTSCTTTSCWIPVAITKSSEATSSGWSSTRSTLPPRVARSHSMDSGAMRSRIFYWVIPRAPSRGLAGAVKMGAPTGYTCLHRMTGAYDAT